MVTFDIEQATFAIGPDVARADVVNVAPEHPHIVSEATSTRMCGVATGHAKGGNQNTQFLAMTP